MLICKLSSKQRVHHCFFCLSCWLASIFHHIRKVYVARHHTIMVRTGSTVKNRTRVSPLYFREPGRRSSCGPLGGGHDEGDIGR